MSAAHHYRAKVAALTRSRQSDDPELLAARRDLAFEMLTTHLERVVGEAPRFTEDQLGALRRILAMEPA